MEFKELSDAERVIGKALNDPTAFREEILPRLDEYHFPEPFHRRLFNVMRELLESRGSYSLPEVYDKLGGDLSQEELSELGYIINDPLCSASSSIGYFVEKLQEARKAVILTRLLDKAQEVVKQGKGKGIDHLIDDMKAVVSSGSMEITSIQKSLEEFNEYIQDDSKTLLSSGISQLDLQLAGGFRNAFLYILAARSGHGKTAMATTLIRNIAKAGKSPYAISIEMKHEEITSRMMNAETGLSDSQYRNHAKEYAEGYSRMYQWKAYIDDGRTVNTIDDIEKRVRYAVKKHHVDIIFIDYIQLINGASKARNRIEEVSAYSRRLKKLATEIDRPIICLSQVTRSSDQRAPIRIRDYKFKVPEMIDLSDSSSLEKDADCILVLSIAENDDGTRPLLYNGRNPAILRIEKNRKGEKGHIIKLEFNGGLTSFTTGNW